MKILSAGADPKSFQFLKNNGYVIIDKKVRKKHPNGVNKFYETWSEATLRNPTKIKN